MTCWRRLRDWRNAGVWPRLHRVLYTGDRMARKDIEPKDRLGRYRWVVERTHHWLHRNRRLKVRSKARGNITLARLLMARALFYFPRIETELC